MPAVPLTEHTVMQNSQKSYMFLCDVITASGISWAAGHCGAISCRYHCINMNATIDGHVFRQPFNTSLDRRPSSSGGHSHGGSGRSRLFITGFEHHCGMLIETFNEWRIGRIRPRLEIIDTFTTITLYTQIHILTHYVSQQRRKKHIVRCCSKIIRDFHAA